MLKNKKLLGIVLASVIMLGAVLFVAFRMNANASQKFVKDGYILDKNAAVEDEHLNGYYFSKNEKYQVKYPDKIVFTDKNGEKVVSEKENFVHYSDNSIMALTKGVFIDLDKLENKPLSYYNIGEDVEMKKQGKGYVAGAQEEVLGNFVWKISDSKYLVASDKVKLHFSEGNEKIVDGYIELSFVDKSVVTLTNNEVHYQTIAEDAYVETANGVRIGLQNKEISKEDTRYLTLAQMVIDSDDNIEVLEKEETKEEDNTSEESDTGSDSVTQNEQVSGGSGTGSSTNASDGKENEQNNTPSNPEEGGDSHGNIEEETEVEFPTLEFTDFSVGLNSVNAKAVFQDNDNLLKGVIRESIYEADTNRLIYYNEYENEGILSIEIRNEKLKPDTNYVMIINADYEYKDETYNKDFGTKSFTTDDLGFTIAKQSVTSNSLSLCIDAKPYSSVSSFRLVLEEKNNPEVTQGTTVYINEVLSDPNYAVHFENLSSNTEYNVKVDNIMMQNVYLNASDMQMRLKTLKKAPEFGAAGVRVLDRTSEFQLYTKPISNTTNKNVIDVDNGIQKYRYEIFLADDITLDTDVNTLTPVKVVETTSTSEVNVHVEKNTGDDAPRDTLVAGVNYVYRLVVEFNDNEKTIEYSNGLSESFIMGESTAPVVMWAPNENTPEQGGISADRITGTVTIDDPSGVVNNKMDIMVIAQGPEEEARTITLQYVSDLAAFPFSMQGFKADTLYYFRVYGVLNHSPNEDDGTVKYSYLGGFTQRTGTPSDIKVVTRELTSKLSEAFQIDFMLTYNDDSSDKNEKFTVSTLRSIQLNLYEGTKEEVVSGKVTYPIRSTRLPIDGNADYYLDEDLTKHSYKYGENTAYRDYFVEEPDMDLTGANKFEITPETFENFSNNQVTAETYTLEVLPGKDYTPNQNAISFYTENQQEERCLIEIKPHGFMPDMPRNPNDALRVNPILNNEESVNSFVEDGEVAVEDVLRPSTVIGYRVQENTFPSASIKYANKVTYIVHDANGNEITRKEITEIDKNAFNLPACVFPVEHGVKDISEQEKGKLYRGNEYYFTYEVELQLSESIKKVYPFDCEDNELGLPLRSNGIEKCEKETPRMYSYLKKTEGNSNSLTQVWETYYLDFDYAIVDETMTVTQNGATSTLASAFMKESETPNTNGVYKADITISGLQPGNVTSAKNIVKTWGTSEPYVMFKNPVEYTVIEASMISYKIDTSMAGKLLITLEGDDTLLSKIATVDLSLRAQNGEEDSISSLPVSELEDGSVQVEVPLSSLTNLVNLIGQECSSSLVVHYDSGLAGVEAIEDENFILKYFDRSRNALHYVNGYDSGLITSEKAYGSLYEEKNRTNYIHDYVTNELEKVSPVIVPTSSLQVTQLVHGIKNNKQFKYAFDSQGMNYAALNTPAPDNSKYYFPSVAKTVKIDGKESVSFDFIPPTVSNVEVVGRLVDAEVTFDVDTSNTSKILDNKGKLLVYKYSDDTLLQEIPFTLKEGKHGYTIEIKDLEINGRYKFELVTTLVSSDGSTSEVRNFIDNDENELKEGDKPYYRLQQTGEVELSNWLYEYQNLSYIKDENGGGKKIRFTFDADVMNGYDLEFYLQDASVVNAELVSIGTKTDDFKYEGATYEVPVVMSETGELVYEDGKLQLPLDRRYNLVVRAMTKGSAPIQIGEDKYFAFTAVALNDSFVSIEPIMDDQTLDFNIVVSDQTFTVEDALFQVAVYKEDETSPLWETNVTLDRTDDKWESTKVFAHIMGDDYIDISKEHGVTYRINVTRKDNKYYTKDGASEVVTSKVVKTPNDEGISLGTSITTMLENDVKDDDFDSAKPHTRIRIDFENPMQLNKVTKISANLIGADGTMKTFEDETPTYILKGDDEYSYYAYYLDTSKESVSYVDDLKPGNYTLNVKFFSDTGNVVGEEKMTFKVSAKNAILRFFENLFH